MWARMRGLLGRTSLEPDEGFFIPACSSIHTWGMRFPIDVVFLDAQMRVWRVVSGLRPWRLAWCPGAKAVLELAAGASLAAQIRRGLAVSLVADGVEEEHQETAVAPVGEGASHE